MNNIPTYNYNNDLTRYKYLERVDKTPDYPSVSELSAAHKYLLHRNHSRHIETRREKFQAGLGSIVGTIIPMILMMKKQGVKNPLKLSYGLKEMLILSGTSVMGGVALGMVGADEESKLNKSKEEYIVVINRNEEFQLDKVISRKKVLSDEFKKVLLDFANDLKNERKYLEYILDNMASLKLDVLENFFEYDEDGRKLIIEAQ